MCFCYCRLIGNNQVVDLLMLDLYFNKRNILITILSNLKSLHFLKLNNIVLIRDVMRNKQKMLVVISFIKYKTEQKILKNASHYR